MTVHKLGGLFFLSLILGSFSLEAQTNFLDPSFNIGTGAQGGFVESMALQPDGKILICGNFTSFNGFPHGYVVRLNSGGSVDTSFVSDVGYWTRYMALQTDGKIVIGGYFAAVAGQPRNCIARLNSNGSLDTTFNVGSGLNGSLGTGVDGKTNAYVFAIKVQTDGKIIFGGNFTSYNGVGRNGIARVNSDGTLDTTFNIGSGVNSWVRSLLIQSNDQIVVSGWFTSYNGHSYNRMVRLNPDGSADTSFSANFGDQTSAYTVAQKPDGKYIVGGHTINPNSVFQQEIVRLNTNGTYDTNFNTGGSGANDKVESVVLQPDGKIVLGGYFNLYNGEGVQSVARLNSDGTLDHSFSATVDNWIWTVLLQPDGKILVCGGFNNVNGVSMNGIARFTSTATLMLFNPKRLSDRFEVSVATQAGKNYSLQYKASMATTNWTALSPVAGDGTVKTLTDSSPSATNRFYRVLQN
jgi:uncharacterized delta-60 repeat protein